MNYSFLGKTGLKVSEYGFGTYRISDNKYHKKALTYALSKGVNLIDTSSNYSDGHSEILIGKVLSELFSNNFISRSNLTIVTKGGYIQGRTFELVEGKEKMGNGYPEIVQCSPDMEHCIHPDFLKDMITISTQRMKLDYLDVYLLHNLEYFLIYNEALKEKDLANEYYRRIKNAFIHLEKEVQAGRIKYYGISSNSFGYLSTEKSFTSLERLIDIAEEVSPDHHFAVIQMPLNIIEKGGAITKNQRNNTKSVLELAKEHDIGILINRPLNAIVGNDIKRLAEFEIKENVDKEYIDSLVEQFSTMESEIADLIPIQADSETASQLAQCLTCSDVLKKNYGQIRDVIHFNEIRRTFLLPRVNYAIKAIHELTNDDSTTKKLNQFGITAEILFDSFESLFALKENDKNRIYHDILAKHFSKIETDLTLSQKCLMMVNSLEGVNCILVGMRSQKYVDDVLNIPDKPVKKTDDFWKDS